MLRFCGQCKRLFNYIYRCLFFMSAHVKAFELVTMSPALEIKVFNNALLKLSF